VLLWLLASATTISFHNPGIRLELFLKELSLQAKQSFKCPTTLNNEVLAASFENQSLDVVKAQLARVIHGVWEKKEDVWWLVQSSDQKKEETNWNLTQRFNLIKYQLDEMSKIAPKSEWTQKDAEKYWRDYQDSRRRTGEGIWNSKRRVALRLQSPENRLGESLAALIKPDQLMSDGMEPGISWYSPSGLRTQIPIKLDVSKQLRQYYVEADLYRSVGGESNLGVPANLEVEISDGDIPYIGFSMYDRAWKYVTSAMPGFFVSSTLRIEGETFALSPKTQETFALLNQAVNLETNEDIQRIQANATYREVLQTLSNANDRDPLGILQGRTWIDFANSIGKPLLVNLEEDITSWRPKYFVPKKTEEIPLLGMVREDTEGWILGRPVNPLGNRAWRMDRNLIQQQSRLQISPDHENWANQLRIYDLTSFNGFYTRGIPNGDFLPNSVYANGLPALLGTLSDQQIQNLFRGETIAADSLPKRAQFYLSYKLNDGSLNVLSPFPENESAAMCPRFCFPNGISGMKIGAAKSESLVFMFGTKANEYTFSVDQMADEVKSESLSPETEFRVGEGITISTYVWLGQKHVKEDINQLTKSDGKTYTWQTLPQNWKAVVLAKIKD
jgi:hypothetical protein